MDTALQPSTVSHPGSRVLSLRGLKVGFRESGRSVYAVNGVDLDINHGETLALVGESGCGKTLTALSIMGLLASHGGLPTAFVEGSASYRGGDEPVELVGLNPQAMDEIRGAKMSMVFQEPMTSLNPVRPIAWQVAEALSRHLHLSSREAHAQALTVLSSVGIPDTRLKKSTYPHQLSGGQRQRVMIAIAMACGPSLLVADEPTTALDVTIQAQILALLRRKQLEQGSAMLLITHNLGIVAQFARRVAIMYAGLILEVGSTAQVFQTPAHPYTRMLLGAVPRLGEPQGQLRAKKLVVIPGAVPSPRERPSGCAFHPRCDRATTLCATEMPGTQSVGAEHFVRCLRLTGGEAS